MAFVVALSGMFGSVADDSVGAMTALFTFARTMLCGTFWSVQPTLVGVE